jgi:hypothetical protein
MWRLLKAELLENKAALLFAWCLVLVPLAANIILDWPTPEKDVPGIRMMMAVGVLAIYISQSLRRFSGKRDRFYLLLPISSKRIGLLRFLPILLSWCTLLVLFWIGTAGIRPYPFRGIFLETLTLSGFMGMASGTVLIFYDIQYLLDKRYQRRLITIFSALTIFMGYLIFYLLFSVSIPYFNFFRSLDPIQERFAGFVSSLSGILIFNILGMGALCLSILIFHRRKSYLN